MNTEDASRPIPSEPMGGQPGPAWRVPAGALRKLVARIGHLDAWTSVKIENRGSGYLYFEFEDADGVLITESIMPGDDTDT